ERLGFRLGIECLDGRQSADTCQERASIDVHRRPPAKKETGLRSRGREPETRCLSVCSAVVSSCRWLPLRLPSYAAALAGWDRTLSKTCTAFCISAMVPTEIRQCVFSYGGKSRATSTPCLTQ